MDVVLGLPTPARRPQRPEPRQAVEFLHENVGRLVRRTGRHTQESVPAGDHLRAPRLLHQEVWQAVQTARAIRPGQARREHQDEKQNGSVEQ